MTGRRFLLVLVVGSLCVVGSAQEAVKGNVWANLDVQLYGYIKADASYDDSRTTPGNYVKWVESENGMPTSSSGANKNDNEFNMTANETRFGFKIKAPQTGKYVVSGQAEWDLYGQNSVSNENKAELMTRHAFITVQDIDTGWSLLAGQTWDVVAPLNPRTLSYTVLWWAGNYGYRRPQIRVEKSYDMGNGQALSVAAAVARTIGSTGLANDDSGADKGYPMLQGRVAWTFPFINGFGSTVGVSGHFGEEEYDPNTAPFQAETVSTWSTCLDVTMPVCKTVSFKGELYRGSNLSQMLGGIGLGVDSATKVTGPEEVHNYGGWVAAAFDPADPWSYNGGYGFSRNADADLSALNRQRNSCLFANAIYDFNKHASAGVEVSRWLTEYKNSADGQAWRAQLSLILRN
ncbi:MAG: hypothetical protein K9N55_19330 [Phycisphaerae bacterium]|nr:hypothetical protein [Phycisphaerae bacterium]